MIRLAVLSLSLIACSACGDDGPNNPVDAPADQNEGIDSSYDPGSCGDQLRFTGEYVDWDVEASFCGIFEASFAERGDGGMDTTAPNGRFDLCVGTDARVIVDITMSPDDSQCTTPASPYPLNAIAVVDRQVTLAGAIWSGRNFTAAKQATLGVTLDPAKAHVFVHVLGPMRDITLSAAHGAPQMVGPSSVFFPNVELGGGTATVSVMGGGLGGGAVPLEANKITNLTVIAQ